MKKVLTASMLAITSAFCMNASAQTNTGTVNVSVTLTPKCVINSTATGTNAVITAINHTYSSFQAAESNASSSFIVRCATGLSYTPSISAGGTANGVNYFTALGTGSASSIGSNVLALASQAGSPAGATLWVNTTAPSGQAGATGATVAEVRTVTLTF